MPKREQLLSPTAQIKAAHCDNAATHNNYYLQLLQLSLIRNVREKKVKNKCRTKAKQMFFHRRLAVRRREPVPAIEADGTNLMTQTKRPGVDYGTGCQAFAKSQQQMCYSKDLREFVTLAAGTKLPRPARATNS